MKRKVEIVVLSDIHLGSRACKAAELLKYLKSIKPQIIILNGNILDTKQLKSLPQDHLRVVNRLMKFLTNDTRVYYLTGETDASLRRFSDFNSGNLFLRDQLVLKLGHKKYCFLHGDALDMHLSIVGRLARFSSKIFNVTAISNKILGKNKGIQSEKVIQKFENNAILYAHTEGYDAVVCGHTHAPKIEQKDTILYLNAGDWTENRTALEYNYGEWSVYRYDPLDFDLINPKLHVPDIDLEDDEAKLLISKKEAKDRVLQKPKEYVLIQQRKMENWVHNESIWDGVEP